MDRARLIKALCASRDDKEVIAFVEQHRAYLDDAFIEYFRRAALGSEFDGPYDDKKIIFLTVLLTALGIYELEHNNPLKAYSFYEEAAELARAQDNSSSRGFILNDLGVCCFRLGKYEEAIDAWQQAITIFKSNRFISDTHPEFYVNDTSRKISWIEMLRYIGTAYEALGQSEITISCWQKAMELSIQANLQDTQGWIIVDFGNLYRKLGYFFEALKYDQLALNFYRQKGDIAGEGLALSFLGLIHSYTGPYEQAIANYTDSLEIARVLKDAQEERNRLCNLARVYALSGQKESALELFRATREVKTLVKAQDDEALILIDASIGNVYRELGQHQDALKYYTNALLLARDANNKKMENRLLSSLGIVYRDLGQMDLAQTHFIASESVARAVKDEMGLGDASGNLGNILYQMGKVVESEPYYREALSIAEKLNDKLFISRWLGNLANVYHALGHKYSIQKQHLWNQSEQLYLKALDLAMSSHDLDHVYLWNYNLGSLYQKTYQQFQRAYDYYQNAITALEIMRHEVKRDDFSRSFGESKVFVYQDMVNVCLQLKARQQEAINFAELGRGYTLKRMMAESHLEPSSEVPKSTREKFDNLRQSQAHLESQIANSHSLEDKIVQRPLVHYQKLIEDLHQVYEARDRNLDEIEKYDPEFVDMVRTPRVEVREIQSHLAHYKKRTALIEFFVTINQTIVFIVSEKHWFVIQIPQFTEFDLQALLNDYWIKPYKCFLTDPDVDKWITNINKIGKKLYCKIWQPLQEKLDQIKPDRLILIPHLGLHLLPLHLITLHKNDIESISSNHAGDYLLNHYEIAYAPSFRMLTYCRNQNRMQRMRLNLFGVSNPDLSLSFSEIETMCISSFFKDFRVLYHDSANRKVIYDEANNYNFIHFATHGTGATLLSDSLEAGIKIGDTTLLTVKEIFKKIRLPKSYTVVLSACETGMIKLDLGDEYIGLPAAFIYAGAPTVVSSLWSVSDVSTALLMYHWYDNICRKNQTRCAALMEAQKWLHRLSAEETITELQKMSQMVKSNSKTIKSTARNTLFADHQNVIEEEIKKFKSMPKTRYPFENPFYWGGFIISGNSE